MSYLRLAAIALGLLFLVACASAPTAPSSHGRDGVDRVSPVRAAEINTRLGVGYMERGQLQLAMEKLDTALRHDPEHTPAHLTMAVIYERLGNTRQAGQHFRQASRLAPTDGAIQNAYAVFLCRQGEFAEAERHFERAFDDPFYATPELAFSNAGTCARRNGDLALAEGYLREALRIDPDFPDGLFQLADLSMEQGEAFRARAFLQRYESVSQPHAGALVLGYQIESALGNLGEAERYANYLEAGFPDSPQARELRSRRHADD